jgi:4-hydroxy-tetrahydrodipicolinate synthase
MTPKLVQFFKGAQDALGFTGGAARPPRLPLDEADRAVLDAALAALRAPAVV